MQTPTSWKMEYEPKTDTLELRIYSTVESDSWWKESETSAKHFSDMLKEYENAKEIKIYINSLGGSVTEGIAIYNQLKRHNAQPVSGTAKTESTSRRMSHSPVLYA